MILFSARIELFQETPVAFSSHVYLNC